MLKFLKRTFLAYVLVVTFVMGVWVGERGWTEEITPVQSALASEPTGIVVDPHVWNTAIKIMERVDLRTEREKDLDALRQAGLL